MCAFIQVMKNPDSSQTLEELARKIEEFCEEGEILDNDFTEIKKIVSLFLKKVEEECTGVIYPYHTRIKTHVARLEIDPKNARNIISANIRHIMRNCTNFSVANPWQKGEN